MDGFKSNPKMKSDIACYKEGGSVYKSRTHKEDPSEAKEDKAMVKKGIRQHESAKHKGEEKTEIKLKNGGRSKKECGTSRKYKAGGGVCNPMKDGGAIDMKKGKDDKKTIAQTKKTKAGKADAPSAASGKKKESPKTTNKAAGKTMTASMVGTLPMAAEAPSAAMDMPMDQPIEMMADGGVLMGQGATSDVERQALMQAMAQQQRRRQAIPQGADFGALSQAGAAGAGMGPTASRGPMGAAAPMGATQDIMRGLQAIGQYAGGGSAC